LRRCDVSKTFTKIKYDGKNVVLAWAEGDVDTSEEYTLKCDDAPHGDFTKALNTFAGHVAELCELPKPWGSDLDVRGVSISHTQGIMGAVITALKPLEMSQSPLVVNTPHKPSEPYSEGDPNAGDYCLSTECTEAIAVLCVEAEAYLKGKRAQGKLFKEKEQEEAA